MKLIQKTKDFKMKLIKLIQIHRIILEKLARERLGMIKPGEKVVNGEITNQN